MSLSSKFLLLLILPNCMFLLSCQTTKHNKSGVESAMRHYDSLILKSDAEAISKLYTPDGNLGGIAVGRDSIRKLLSSFKDVRVLSQSTVTESINIVRDTAIQKGTYNQTALLNGKDTVTAKGEFTVRWQWLGKEGWHVKQMTTKSTN